MEVDLRADLRVTRRITGIRLGWFLVAGMFFLIVMEVRYLEGGKLLWWGFVIER